MYLCTLSKTRSTNIQSVAFLHAAGFWQQLEKTKRLALGGHLYLFYEVSVFWWYTVTNERSDTCSKLLATALIFILTSQQCSIFSSTSSPDWQILAGNSCLDWFVHVELLTALAFCNEIGIWKNNVSNPFEIFFLSQQEISKLQVIADLYLQKPTILCFVSVDHCIF